MRIINKFSVNCLVMMLLFGGKGQMTIPSNHKTVSHFKFQDDPVWVRYCDLIANPGKYNGRVVATEAIIVVNTVFVVDGGEPFLYDPKCDKSETSRLLLEFESSAASDPDSLKESEKIVAKARARKQPARVRELIVGRFYGPKSHGGYGHLDWARFKLGVFGIQKAEEVAEDTPWPLGYIPAK